MPDDIPTLLGCAVALGLLVTINIFATRYILRTQTLIAYRIGMTAVIWIVPFVGALLARLMALKPMTIEDAYEEEPGIVEEAAPTELRFGEAPVFSLAENLQHPGRLPLLDWHAAQGWANQLASPTLRDAAIDLARRGWLLHMRDALGAHMHLYESEYAYVLSSLEPAVVRATAGYVSATRKRISRVLDGVAHFSPAEKSVLLVLDDRDLYYEYTTIYQQDEEGESALSGGMFIDAGCPHFVVPRANLTQIEPVIAHELTHSSVRHLKLPLWLDEGLAVNTERRLAGNRGELYTPQEMRQKHLAFWGDEEIAQFWSGESFRRSDDGNLLSYDLARILVEQLGRDWTRFKEYVASARREDAGLEAAHELLGVDLPAYVDALLQRNR